MRTYTQAEQDQESKYWGDYADNYMTSGSPEKPVKNVFYYTMEKQSDGTYLPSEKPNHAHSKLVIRGKATARNTSTNIEGKIDMGDYGIQGVVTNVYTYWNANGSINRQVVVSSEIMPTTKIPVTQEEEIDYELPEGLYKIKKGDTFAGLEKSYGLKYGSLQLLNPEVNPRTLKIGSIITLSEPHAFYEDKVVDPLMKKYPESGGYGVSLAGYEEYKYDLFIAIKKSESFSGMWSTNDAEIRDKSVTTGTLWTEFRKNQGSINSIFGPDHPLTGAVKFSDVVENFVNFTENKFDSQGFTLERLPYFPVKSKQVTEYAASFGLLDFYGGRNGMVGTNDYMGQWLGSFTGDAFLTRDGKYIIYIVSDSKSYESLSYRLGTNHERFKDDKFGYGNTRQKYIWFRPWGIIDHA